MDSGDVPNDQSDLGCASPATQRRGKMHAGHLIFGSEFVQSQEHTGAVHSTYTNHWPMTDLI